MEVYSKGIHSALVPLDTQMEHVIGVELAEASPGYRMLTQMDVLTVINHHKSELQEVLGRSLKELGAINQNAKAVTNRDTVLNTIMAMRTASLNVVPVVDAFHPGSVDDRQLIDVIGVELAEASPGYRMLTQMDVLTVINHHKSELQEVLGRSLKELGAINQNAKAVTNRDTVLNTIMAMRTASLNVVPVVDAFHPGSVDDRQLIDGIGKKLVGTFSSTDLRGCPIAQLKSWLHLYIVEFTEKMTRMEPQYVKSSPIAKKLLVTCNANTSLAEVISMAVKAHVHRVWIVDSDGLLRGLVALTDMLRVIRETVLASQL